MKRSVLILIIVVFAVAALSAVTYADHSWANYHWARQSSPFDLNLGDNVSSKWDAYLAEASSDWCVSSVLDTTIASGGTRPKQGRMTSGMIEVCSDKYGRRGCSALPRSRSGAITSSPAAPSNEHPNQHDYGQLATIYNSHADPTRLAWKVAPNGAAFLS